MPAFTVNHSSRLAASEAFERVSALIENEPKFRELDPDYTCEFDSAQLSGTAKSRLFDAQLEVSPKTQGCDVSMTINLPMKYALAKGMISKALLKKMRSEL